MHLYLPTYKSEIISISTQAPRQRLRFRLGNSKPAVLLPEFAEGAPDSRLCEEEEGLPQRPNISIYVYV